MVEWLFPMRCDKELPHLPDITGLNRPPLSWEREYCCSATLRCNEDPARV